MFYVKYSSLMLADAFFKIVGMTCVVATVGTAKNVYPKHLVYPNLANPFTLRQAQGERSHDCLLFHTETSFLFSSWDCKAPAT